MLHSPYVQCHPAIYQTFLTFVAYGVVDFIMIVLRLMIKFSKTDDTHSKLLDPQIVTFVFENQHQSMWPNPGK
jgi:hypothetical protein